VANLEKRWKKAGVDNTKGVQEVIKYYTVISKLIYS